MEHGFRNEGNICVCNLESWALQSGIQLKESGIPLTIAIRNPSSTDKESEIRYLESGIHRVESSPESRVQNPESRIQVCLGFLYMGQKQWLLPRFQET